MMKWVKFGVGGLIVRRYPCSFCVFALSYFQCSIHTVTSNILFMLENKARTRLFFYEKLTVSLIWWSVQIKTWDLCTK